MKRKFLAMTFSFAFALSLASCTVEGPIGPAGPQGEQGLQGEPGQNGQDGNSVISIELTSSEDNVDTYTITYSDGSTSTFKVTNGVDGADGEQGIQGIQGEKGEDGHTPEINIGENGNWFIDGVDSGISTTRKDEFKVTYHLNGGSLPNGEQQIEYVVWGNTLNLPTPTKKGYIFKGWFTGDTIHDKQFFKTDAVFLNLDLYAKWEIGQYTLTLDYDGGLESVTELSYNYLDTYNLPVYVYKKGFEFEGWSLNGEIIPFTGIYDYENTVVKAIYKSVNEYKINLELDGGKYAGETNMNISPYQKYTLPNEGVDKEGFAFAGWYEGNVKWDFDGIYNVKKSTYLKAKWVPLKTYDITLISELAQLSYTLTNDQLYKGYKLREFPSTDDFTFKGYAIGNYLVTDNKGLIDAAKLEYASRVTKQTTFKMIPTFIGEVGDFNVDYCEFGNYPQTKEKDVAKLKALKIATDIDGDGYLNLGDDEYTILKNEDNVSEYFKIEPILWEVKQDGTLFSSVILDCHCIYESAWDERLIDDNVIIGSNYKYSNMRAFLNGYDGTSYEVKDYTNNGFYDIAFSEKEKEIIKTSLIDNSEASTLESPNQNICENTNDKVFLLSVEEVNRKEYKFNSQLDLVKDGTDYAYGKGLYDYLSTGVSNVYFLRSPNHEEFYEYYAVLYDGSIEHAADTNIGLSGIGVTPAIRI